MGLPQEVLPCLRRKDFRRGAQDYEHLWLLQKAGEETAIGAAMAAIYNPAAVSIGRDGSPKIQTGDLGVTMDEHIWESVHRQMGERLDQPARPPVAAHP